MTSHPSIDLFIVVSVALLTQGNWAVPCAHVPAFAVHGVGGWRGGEKMLTGTKVAEGQQASGIRWS